MTLLLASTFNDALTKLTQAEAGAAMQAGLRYGDDPTGNGLQMHRIAKTDGFWSLRASRDIRIILHKDGGATTLAYVGHHDDAYAWAERRRIVPHERTGAMQIVRLVEREGASGERKRQDPTPRSPTPAPPVQPFWSLTDDEMLDVGVPREWLQPVREMAEAEVETLFDRLPGEAAEALYDFATGGDLQDHVAAPAAPDADPFAHPDAQRRFRVLDNVEELQAALDSPFEKWAVFLHPAQRELVERTATGPTRVTGSAGTGKTIVALHRAVHLVRASPEARVLITTFSDPLAEALEAKRDILTQADRALRTRIAVRPLDRAATELYTQAFGQPDRATASQIHALIGDAMKAGLGGDLSAGFLFEEWQELVDAWGVTDPETYTTIPRTGRRTRLGPRQREAAWSVFDQVRRRLDERGLVTWAAIYGRLTDWLEKGGDLPFDHVVVDESQDLSVAQVRFLAAAARAGSGGLGGARPDALFLAGDIGQRIFRLPFSWARLGLDIRGRSHSLRVNYRTSHQIRATADRLLPASITDMDGIEEGRGGTVSVFDGPAPQIAIVEDEQAERATVSDWLGRCLGDAIAPSQIALLVRSEGQLSRARAAIEAAGLDPRGDAGIALTTMHGAKGLEFRAVAVMACDENVLPDPVRLSAIGDVAELETAYETERHLLYVACTRARDRLLVSGVAPGSEFLDDLQVPSIR